MAQNVDLMVVGTSDDVSADELTQRLVSEFGQPAEAFTDLVAAACSGENAYAAQSSVSLDTAVEGQAQLEKLGVVCEVLMDGEVMGNSPATAPDAIEPGAEPVEIPEADPVAKMPDPDPAKTEIAEPAAEPEVSAPAPDAPDDSDQLPVTNGLEITDVGFGDELDMLGGDSSKDEATAESIALDEHLPAENGLEVADISFSDELGSLDDEIEKTREKIKIDKAEATEKAAAVAKGAEKAEKSGASETKPEKVEPVESAETGIAIDESEEEPAKALEISDDQDDADLTFSEDNSSPGDDTPPGEELELSLSVDDSTPLTKPKTKSNKVADDGGLTLSLDDDAPLVAPKKSSGNPKPEALDATLSLDNEPLAKVEEKPVPVEEPVKVEAKSAAPVDPVPEVAEEVAVPAAEPAIEARDTSRELKEEVAPILDEPEPEQPDESEKNDAEKPTHEDKAVAADQTPDASPDVDVAPVAVAPAADTSALGNLIDNLSESSGGLVLPGQTATDGTPAAAENDMPLGRMMAGTESEAIPEVAEPQAVQTDALSVGEIDSNDPDESGGLLPEHAKSRAKANRLKIAAAATLVVGLFGGVGAVYMTGGFDELKAEVPVVATVAPINENSALEAVEEGSLNAAIKRSSDISNPDDYSTEELIVYLADDLGANARKELQNYVSGDGEYEVAPQDVPRMGAAIPADSNSVLWLKNRVAHRADQYFDEWSKREVDLQAYMELQERLIEVGDLEIARDVSGTTKDKLFAVMSLQRLARSYNELGRRERAIEMLELATRATYSIASESERTIAIADYALSEKEMGLEEDSLDSFLKASILARSLRKPESRTVALSAIAEYYQRVDRSDDMAEYLDLAMTTAYELPVNTAARDLAIRHVALTEVRLGLTAQATDHANLIVDPFAAVSALHGIALELERTGDQTNARLTLNMAYRAGSLIKNSEKREKLLEKIKLAGG